MSSAQPSYVPLEDSGGDVALQRSHWRMRGHLSSVGDAAERFLERAGIDRAPWLAVAFANGIATWFVLKNAEQWLLAICFSLMIALGALALWRGNDRRTQLLSAVVAIGLLTAAGVSVIWARSENAGAAPIDHPVSTQIEGLILERIEQPAEGRIRLVIATREPGGDRAIKVRLNVSIDRDDAGLVEGSKVRLRARLMPPTSPMLPGAYDFARTAWFSGLAATGSVQGTIEIVQASMEASALAGLQRDLSSHVRSRMEGSAGAIAAAFASGDRGGIAESDETAMRDSGLTHLLSISGLHVSAVIAAAYFLAIRLLAFWPWLTLRIRLPLAAAATGALAGAAYTLLTGAEVPTVRSCVGAILVLIALALGREPLSMRMIAVTAFVVLLVWPEALSGPSFQMSFSAVIAIVALHGASPVRAFLAPRDERWIAWAARRATMLLVTGLVIEIALMPVVLFHFHRAGMYGALANVVAIPLVTFGSMPMIALGLFLDLFGIGEPAWWLAGKSLDLLLWIAHFTAGQPGAVKLMPQMTGGVFALFVLAGMWLALWRGRMRLAGLGLAALATGLFALTPVPDILISGDGRHVGISGEGDRLIVLRESRSDFARDNLLELSGQPEEPVLIQDWPGAQCSPDFCIATVNRNGRDWRLLMSVSGDIPAERDLAAACERVDVVVSDRWLPRSCKPRWIKADGRSLAETGGLALILDGERISSVADSQGEHGWWHGATQDAR